MLYTVPAAGAAISAWVRVCTPPRNLPRSTRNTAAGCLRTLAAVKSFGTLPYNWASLPVLASVVSAGIAAHAAVWSQLCGLLNRPGNAPQLPHAATLFQIVNTPVPLAQGC